MLQQLAPPCAACCRSLWLAVLRLWCRYYLPGSCCCCCWWCWWCWCWSGCYLMPALCEWRRAAVPVDVCPLLTFPHSLAPSSASHFSPSVCFLLWRHRHVIMLACVSHCRVTVPFWGGISLTQRISRDVNKATDSKAKAKAEAEASVPWLVNMHNFFKTFLQYFKV